MGDRGLSFILMALEGVRVGQGGDALLLAYDADLLAGGWKSDLFFYTVSIHLSISRSQALSLLWLLTADPDFPPPANGHLRVPLRRRGHGAHVRHSYAYRCSGSLVSKA